jgi:CRP-like cAMP-binding protein
LSAISSSELIIRKLQSISEIGDDDEAALRRLPIQERDFRANQNLVLEGDRPACCFAVLEGFVCAYKHTGEGKRQIIGLFIAGDIPDLHGMHLGVMDCTFSTITPCKLGLVRHDALRAICEQHPRITTALWRATLIDASIFREWVTNVGRREAYARMAHIFCELIVRLRFVGLVEDHTIDLPITQAVLGDAMGVSTIHVNRTLQELRHDGLIATSGTKLRVLDWSKLLEAGDFNPAYLHQNDLDAVFA